MSNSEETTVIYLDEEQLADIVKLKVAGIICNVTLMEGETPYETNTGDLFLIQ